MDDMTMEATPGYTRGERSRLSGKEKRKTTNALYLTDQERASLAMSI